MTRARVAWGVSALVFLCVDVLGYYQTDGEFHRWMTRYGHDTFLPAFLYFFCRTTWIAKINRRAWIGLYVTGGCFAFESAQRLGWYAGVFDPWDLVCYATGTLLATGLDVTLVHTLVKTRAPKSATS